MRKGSQNAPRHDGALFKTLMRGAQMVSTSRARASKLWRSRSDHCWSIESLRGLQDFCRFCRSKTCCRQCPKCRTCGNCQKPRLIFLRFVQLRPSLWDAPARARGPQPPALDSRSLELLGTETFWIFNVNKVNIVFYVPKKFAWRTSLSLLSFRTHPFIQALWARSFS